VPLDRLLVETDAPYLAPRHSAANATNPPGSLTPTPASPKSTASNPKPWHARPQQMLIDCFSVASSHDGQKIKQKMRRLNSISHTG
jgi:hypothetical protein